MATGDKPNEADATETAPEQADLTKTPTYNQSTGEFK